jgi:hypothetical protein
MRVPVADFGSAEILGDLGTRGDEGVQYGICLATLARIV